MTGAGGVRGDDLALRACVTLAALGGVAALSSAGLLSRTAAVVLGTCAVGCSAANRVRDLHSGPGQARLACWIVLCGLTVALSCAGWARGTDDSPLGPALSGFVCATLLELDGTRRAASAHLCLSLAVLALAAGLSPGPHLTVWTALVTTSTTAALARAATLAQLRSGGTVMSRRAGPGRRGPAGRFTDPGTRAAVRAAVLTDGVDVLACAAVCLLLLGCAVQLLPAGGRIGTRGGGVPGTGAGNDRTMGVYAGGGLDLRARGRLPDTPVLSVPAGSPSLWRTAALEIYTGRSWQAVPRFAAEEDLGTGTVAVTGDPTEGLPADAGRSVPVRTDDVRALSRDRPVVAAPGVPVTVVTGSGAHVRRQPDGRLALGSGTGYTVVSVPRGTVGDPGTGTGTGTDPAGQDEPASGLGPGRWTQLPEGLPARVRDLGRELGGPARGSGAGGAGETVRRIEEYLRAHLRYRQGAAVPAPGRDAVDDFLFGTREGFCEQFASAEVVLLRVAGIPARLAVGFAGGRTAGDRRILRGRDAHSWVEVWIPGQGWTWSDPTAGALEAGDARPSSPWYRNPYLLGLPAVLLLLLLGARNGARGIGGRGRGDPPDRPRRGDAAARGRPAELITAFAQLERALGRAGTPRPPTQTLKDLASRLAGSAGVPEALGVMERLLYGAVAPPAGELSAAAEALRAESLRLSGPDAGHCATGEPDPVDHAT